jgi:hypothetical protein
MVLYQDPVPDSNDRDTEHCFFLSHKAFSPFTVGVRRFPAPSSEHIMTIVMKVIMAAIMTVVIRLRHVVVKIFALSFYKRF